MKKKIITTEMVKAIRKRSGLTQEKAGQRVHCSLRGWQNWEYGATKMPMSTYELFALKTEDGEAKEDEVDEILNSIGEKQ